MIRQPEKMKQSNEANSSQVKRQHLCSLKRGTYTKSYRNERQGWRWEGKEWEEKDIKERI